ncbi:MAG TPA: hypothetical protein VM695_04385 [Phycisphaerae bacterium]|nr:hypothetical protein [Phycisphaerae bacterium]
MALTSSSTVLEALEQYSDNLVWEGDSTKAVLALEAVRFLLAHRPQNLTTGGVAVSHESLLTQEQALSAFVARSSLTGRRSFTRGVPLLD